MSPVHFLTTADPDDSGPLDQYEQFEAMFDPMVNDRKSRRLRKPKVKHTPKKDDDAVLREIADTTGLEAGFKTTYQPGLFEEGWLLDSVRTFYERDFISDILFKVRGGKEATVYCGVARPSVGLPLVAVKVYRPRMFRNLRNDKLYREGRAILLETGQAVRKNDHRVMRAIGKKSAFGLQVEHTSWLMHEMKVLQLLFNAGANVPRPIASSENAILMSFHGDERAAAPTLSGVTLSRREAEPLFKQVMHNVEIMLAKGIVHGDLSAYNIMYWEGAITLIDFPQVVEVYSNRSARQIFIRDVTRVCEYFAAQGVARDADYLAQKLWDKHIKATEAEDYEE